MSTHSPVLCCVRTDASVVVSAKTVPGFGGLVSLITLGGAVHPRHNSRSLHILCYFNLSRIGMWELPIKLSNRHCMWGWGCPMIRVHVCHGSQLGFGGLAPKRAALTLLPLGVNEVVYSCHRAGQLMRPGVWLPWQLAFLWTGFSEGAYIPYTWYTWH